MDVSGFTIVKYASAAFSAAYGLYATVTDFKEKKDGRKVLSTKGYIGILLLGISSVLSISTDRWKDIKDAKETHDRDVADDAARKAVSDQLTDQLKRTKDINAVLQHQNDQMVSILDQTTRIVQPIKSLKVSFAIALPSDLPDVANYVSRIDKGLQPLMPELQNSPYNYKGVATYPTEPGKVYISPESELYPSEADGSVTRLASDDVFTMSFYVSPEAFARVGQTPPWDPGHSRSGTSTPPDIHIVLNTPCKRDTRSQTQCHMTYEIGDHRVLLVVLNADVSSEQWHNSGQIKSVPELLNSSVDFSWYYPINDHPPTKQTFAIEVKSELSWLSVTTADGVVYSGERIPVLQGAQAQYGGKVAELLKLQ